MPSPVRARNSIDDGCHINHPNFGSRVTAEDIMATRGARFFEVFNGHGEVNNWGDPTAGLPSTDRLWISCSPCD